MGDFEWVCLPFWASVTSFEKELDDWSLMSITSFKNQLTRANCKPALSEVLWIQWWEQRHNFCPLGSLGHQLSMGNSTNKQAFVNHYKCHEGKVQSATGMVHRRTSWEQGWLIYQETNMWRFEGMVQELNKGGEREKSTSQAEEMENRKALEQIGNNMERNDWRPSRLRDHTGEGGSNEATEVERSLTGEAFLVSQVKNLELYGWCNWKFENCGVTRGWHFSKATLAPG